MLILLGVVVHPFLEQKFFNVEIGIFLLLPVNGHFARHSAWDGVVRLGDLRVYGGDGLLDLEDLFEVGLALGLFLYREVLLPALQLRDRKGLGHILLVVHM